MKTVKISLGSPEQPSTKQPFTKSRFPFPSLNFLKSRSTKPQSTKPESTKPESTEPKSTKLPRFIVLCGPTGVGKGKAPEQIFNLTSENYTKIEIDSLVVQNQLYISTIYTINKLDSNLIERTIDEKNKEQHQLLTDLFNTLYFNVKNNIIPCLESDLKKEKITCSQLHDKMLGDAISEKRTIVLEINGDKPFNWLFEDSKMIGDLFTDKHRKILRENYKKTICYLSHDYKSLLDSNKNRFKNDIKKCNLKECIARLGNFLLPDIYGKTISNIFKVYEELLSENVFKNIEIVFYERVYDKKNKTYIYSKLSDFQAYKNSFNLGDESSEKDIVQPSISLAPPPTPRGRHGGSKKAKSKKQKSKKQKAKSKTQKSKKQKKYKKLKLL
jgi:hypothetical protein